MKKFAILTRRRGLPRAQRSHPGGHRPRQAHHNAEVMGIRGGWKGLTFPDTIKLTRARVDSILNQGGAILGISRFSPYHVDGGVARLAQNVKDFNIHGLIAVGEGALSLAKRLHEEVGLPVVGVPKTIDNDVSATEETFGFDTAVSVATDAIDRLRTTARSA